MSVRRRFAKKPLVSSILLWARTDQPRQQGMDYWKGPHSKIISATPGMDEHSPDPPGGDQARGVAGAQRLRDGRPSRIDGLPRSHPLRRAAHANKPRPIEDRA